MDKTRVLLFASVVAAAMVFGGVIGATALAGRTLTPASAAQETAENNGTFHPGGHSGPSNETATHEAGESAAREAAETT